MHSRSSNITFIFYNEANEIIGKLFESLCSRTQGNLETSMRESGSIFDSVQLMYYKGHEVNFKRGGSYNDYPDSIQNKKSDINLKNKDDKW